MLEKLQMKLSPQIKNIIGEIISILYFPEIIALKILANKRYRNFKDIWLICERGIEAKDNGSVLFKYIKNENLNQNTYYIMDKKNYNDYKYIKNLGNIIQYKSIEHKLLYIKSEKLISTHMNTIIPWKYCRYKSFNKTYKKIIGDKKYIFLQHGIIRGDLSKELSKSNTDVDLFISGAKREYEYILERFGYNSNQLVFTGLARFDNLHDFKISNQILVMPSWRHYLKGLTENDFLNSDYYKVYQNLIQNQGIIKILEKHDIKLIFYPHHEMQKYLHLFKSYSDKIIIANKEEYSVQKLLKESKLLITDYSSVYFDFAYMNKPIIYYHSQIDERISDTLVESYFKYDKDGFGNIVTDEKSCINEIEKFINKDFKLEDKYYNKINEFFGIRDNENCKRIYNEIMKLK